MWSSRSRSARVDINQNLLMFDADGSDLKICCESGSSCGASYVPPYGFVLVR